MGSVKSLGLGLGFQETRSRSLSNLVHVQVGQIAGRYHYKLVGVRRLPCKIVKLEISGIRVRVSGTKKR